MGLGHPWILISEVSLGTNPVDTKGGLYCEMITTVSLVNIHHFTQLRCLFPCDENFLNLLSQQLTNIWYSIVDHSHHIVHYIPTTYLSFNWKFVPFDRLHPISTCSISLLKFAKAYIFFATNIFYLHGKSIFFQQCKYV